MSTESPSALVAWVLGVSSATYPRAFEAEAEDRKYKREPKPTYDTKLRVTSNDTVYELVNTLCENVVKDRREYGSKWGLNDHKWKLKLVGPSDPLEESSATNLSSGYDYGGHDWSCLLVQCPSQTVDVKKSEDEEEDYNPVSEIDMHTKISDLDKYTFMVGSKLHLSYDDGCPTDIFLLVIEKDEIQLGMLPAPPKDDSGIRYKVKAYSLSAEKRIDTAYPRISKNLFHSPQVQFITLGLSSRVSRGDEVDSVFCCVRGIDEDICFCPLPFGNMDHLFALLEQGWSSGNRKERPLLLLPPTDEGKRLYKKASTDLLVNGRDFVYKAKVDSSSRFTFNQAFPQTAEQLMSGRFRYFRYDFKAGELKVIAGRSSSVEDHNAPSSQVLRTWNRKFDSFHELLCAVEASWIHPDTKKPLGNTLLPEHDTHVGPSPLPPEPPCLSTEQDAVYVTKDGPRVTALAVACEDNESKTPFVISGHADGSVRKWNLATQTMEWEKFPDGARMPRSDQETGIRTLAVRRDPKRGHVVYVASFFEVNLEKVKEDDESFVKEKISDSVVRVLKVSTGKRVDKIELKKELPLTGAMVFANVRYEDDWTDCMMLSRLGSCRDRVVPVCLDTRGGEEMGDWTGPDDGYSCHIRQLASLPTEKVLVGVFDPDHICLWSLTHPGSILFIVAIHKAGSMEIDKKDSNKSMEAVGGIAVDGTKLLVCGDYGDTVVAVDLVNEVGVLDPQLRGIVRLGYRQFKDSSCHGHLAGCGSEAVVVNSDWTKPLIFSINELVERLDLEQDFAADNKEKGVDEDARGKERFQQDRLKAAGTVTFPARGGKPRGKRSNSLMDPLSPDYNDKGPRVLALNGRHVIAGFSNGVIMQSLLPEGDRRVLKAEYGETACGRTAQVEEMTECYDGWDDW